MTAATARATNVLAVDLARDNEALRARVAELEARLATLTPSRITIGDRVIDLVSGWIWQGDVPAGHLTRTELRLINVLAMAPGRAVPWADICAAVWPQMHPNETDFQRALQTNLSRIRQKLDGSKIIRHGDGSTASRHFRSAHGIGLGLVP